MGCVPLFAVSALTALLGDVVDLNDPDARHAPLFPEYELVVDWWSLGLFVGTIALAGAALWGVTRGVRKNTKSH